MMSTFFIAGKICYIFVAFFFSTSYKNDEYIFDSR